MYDPDHFLCWLSTEKLSGEGIIKAVSPWTDDQSTGQ